MEVDISVPLTGGSRTHLSSLLHAILQFHTCLKCYCVSKLQRQSQIIDHFVLLSWSLGYEHGDRCITLIRMKTGTHELNTQ